MEEFHAYKKDLVTPGAPFSHSSMKPYKVFRGGLRRKRGCCFSFPGSPFTLSPLARVQFLWTHPRRPEEWRQSFSPLPTPRSRVSLLLFVSFKLGIKKRNWDFNVRRFLMWPLHSPGSACTPRGTEPSASLSAVWDKGRRDALHRQRRWSSGALEAHTSGKKSSDTCPNLCLLSVLVSRNDFGPTDPSAKVSGFPSYALKPTPPRRGGALHSTADPPSSHQREKMHLGVFISAAQVPPCQFQCTRFMKRLIQGNWCGSLGFSLLRFPPLRVLPHSCFLLTV